MIPHPSAFLLDCSLGPHGPVLIPKESQGIPVASEVFSTYIYIYQELHVRPKR